jgi:hypothetical protein
VEVFVENFDKVVDGFQVIQVVIHDVDTNAEVETGVSSVDNLEISEFNKIGVLGIAHCDHSMHLLNQLLLLVVVKVHIPLSKTGLASSILN